MGKKNITFESDPDRRKTTPELFIVPVGLESEGASRMTCIDGQNNSDIRGGVVTGM